MLKARGKSEGKLEGEKVREMIRERDEIERLEREMIRVKD